MSGTGNTLTLTIADFRSQFPQFGNPVQYTDNTLDMSFAMASVFISPTDFGYINGLARLNVLYLMMAHIMQLNVLAAENNGASPGFTTEARVDKVAVTIEPPPVKSQFGWWLNQTAYGAQLWAVLKVYAVGGTYVGGRPELGAFRRVGGFGSYLPGGNC
jgi:hypothetical protein